MARILVVDDDDDFRDALTALLEKPRHEVTNARNAALGLKPL
jgi:CheY-like chemotaxis protein